MDKAVGKAVAGRSRGGFAAVMMSAALLAAACAAPRARPAAQPAVSTQQREAADELYRQGVEQYLAGDLKGAVRTWRLVLQKDPRHRHAKSSLARAEMELEALRKRGKT